MKQRYLIEATKTKVEQQIASADITRAAQRAVVAAAVRRKFAVYGLVAVWLLVFSMHVAEKIIAGQAPLSGFLGFLVFLSTVGGSVAAIIVAQNNVARLKTALTDFRQ